MKLTLPNTGVVIWGQGTDTVTRSDFNTAFQNIEDRAVVALAGARPSAGQGRRIHVDNAGKFSYDDGTRWVPLGGNVDKLETTSTSPTTVALSVTGAASQSANLTEWRNSAGTTLAFVTPTGGAKFLENTLGGSLAALLANPASAGRKGLIVRGASSQTANLTEWQNSAGTALASISSTGSITGKGLTVDSANVGGAVNSDTITTNSFTSKFAILEGVAGQNYLTAGTLGRLNPSGQFAVKQVIVGQDLTGVAAATPAAALLVKNNVAGDTSIKVSNATSQTGRSIDVLSGATSIFSVANNGAISTNSTVKATGSGTFQGGIYTSNTPLAIGGKTPVAEIITGTAAAGFVDEFVLRHSATSTTVAERINRIGFRLGDESASGTNRMAAIGVVSNSANSDGPMLTGWQANEQVFQFSNGSKRLDLAGNITLAGRIDFFGGASRQNLTFDTNVGIGNTGGTLYARYNKEFVLVKGGTHADGSGSIAVGGNVRMKITEAGALINYGAIESNSFKVGDTYIENGHINAYTPGQESTYGTLSLNYQAIGGDVVVNNPQGTTTLNGTVSASIFKINGRRVWIGPSAPASPQSGDLWVVS